MPFVWLVEPPDRFVEAYRLDSDRWVRLGVWEGSAPAGIPPFDAAELELGTVWLPAVNEPDTP